MTKKTSIDVGSLGLVSLVIRCHCQLCGSHLIVPFEKLLGKPKPGTPNRSLHVSSDLTTIGAEYQIPDGWKLRIKDRKAELCCPDCTFDHQHGN